MRESSGQYVHHDVRESRKSAEIRWMPTIYVTEDGEVTKKTSRNQRIIKRHLDEVEHYNQGTGRWELRRYTTCVLEQVDGIQGILF